MNCQDRQQEKHLNNTESINSEHVFTGQLTGFYFGKIIADSGCIISVLSLVVAMYATYAERKVLPFCRIGVDLTGQVLLVCFNHWLMEENYFLKKRSFHWYLPNFLFILGPCLAMITALLTSAVIPWGAPLCIYLAGIYPMQIADINIGILFVFGVVSMGVYGIMIGGWASNNKFSLMAAIRGASQMISYELPMGLALIALLMIVGDLKMSAIVSSQLARYGWHIIYQPLGFIIFFVCALAECNRTPFDLPEAENELNFGYHQEYSSMKLGFYLFAEYINMFISSVVMATLYFGGYDIPFVNEANWGLNQNLDGDYRIFGVDDQSIFFVFVFMWIRWTIPRFRYDQLMNLGWKNIDTTGID